MVVAGGVEGEVSEEFAGGGVDDADVEVLDQDDDVGSSDADGVEPALVAQGDLAGLVDAVVGVAAAVGGGGGLGPRCVDAPWWWVRCQAMVSAPLSSPVAASCLRSRSTSSTSPAGVALGLVFGARERGSKAASPSSR